MTNAANSEDDKVAFFALLGSLAGPAVEADDELSADELERRRKCLGFFRPSSRQDAASQSRKRAGQSREKGPRRVVSAPIGRAESPPAQVIAATQATSARARKGRLDALLAAEPGDVDETVIPDSTRAAAKGHRRSGSTPAMPLDKRLSAGLVEASPSVGAGTRKRKRVSGETKLRPEEDRIFRGLAFFYLPDNDIAPARRLRIGKAREYGAAWVRDVAAATHVVADTNITYGDVEKLAAQAGLGALPTLVNEEYPIDCIRFKSLLDHDQKKYHVAGQPAKGLDDARTAVPDGSAGSDESLQLKPHNDKKQRVGRAPEMTTPRHSGESSQKSVIEATPGAATSAPVVFDESYDVAQGAGDEARHAKDELSGFIDMMQEFKDLPLDNEDDDGASEPGRMDPAPRGDEAGDSEEQADDTGDMPSRLRWKPGEFKNRFACNHAGEKDAYADNPNARTVQVLQSMTDYYDRTNDHWRTMGYRKAIATLKRQSVKICTEAEAVRLPHIGQRIAQKIEEIVTTDRLRRLEYAQDEPTDGALALFLQIYGVGISQAQRWIAQGYRTLDDLRQKVRLTPSQKVGIEHFDDLATRIPRREVAALGAVVKKAAAVVDPTVELIIGGSFRRGAESSQDIDLIVTKGGTTSAADLRPFLDALVARLERDGFLVARLASSRTVGEGSMWHGCCVLPRSDGVDGNEDEGNGGGAGTWRRIDFLLVPETEMGGALIYFTGNDIFNRSMRLLARRKGMRLNQRGLYKDVLPGQRKDRASEGTLVEGRDERRIFEILGVRWREPHERWC